MKCLTSLFNLSKSAYYRAKSAQPNVRKAERIRLTSQLTRWFIESRRAAGSRYLVNKFRLVGEFVGRYKVRQLMKEAGLFSKQPKHRYRNAVQERIDAPNALSRQFEVPQKNQVWCGDITYIWTGKQWGYLATVMDLHARRVVGWAMSDAPNAQLACDALNMALQIRGKPKGLMFHSDQGVQYASAAYRAVLFENRIAQSMSRRGNCWDNAPMERLFRSLKSEWIPKLGYLNLNEAKVDVGFYLMTHYNHDRPHAANNGLPPALAENTLK